MKLFERIYISYPAVVKRINQCYKSSSLRLELQIQFRNVSDDYCVKSLANSYVITRT